MARDINYVEGHFMKSGYKRMMPILIGVLLLSDPVFSQSVLSREQINHVSRALVQIHSLIGSGSGSIIPETALIITNRHVVEGSEYFIISAPKESGQKAEPLYFAELVAFSGTYDFAILKIISDLDGNPINESRLFQRNRYSQGFSMLEYAGASGSTGIGDEIAVFGFPSIGGRHLVYTTGIISSVGYETYNNRRVPVWYRTNAELFPGNSGGIAVNRRGEFIGIPTSIRTDTRTGGSLGNILSVQVIREILESRDLLTSWDELPETSGSRIATVNPESYPTFGETRLRKGFFPDPHRKKIISGGLIDASTLSSNCGGYIASTPDFRVIMDGPTGNLSFNYYPQSTLERTSIVIKLPDGRWVCSDGSLRSSNPHVNVRYAASGEYNIWIGNSRFRTYTEGELHITEIEDYYNPGLQSVSRMPETSRGDHQAQSRTVNPDHRMPPHFGNIKLYNGFTPHPFSMLVESGGDLQLSRFSDNNCSGYLTKQPSVVLNWQGHTRYLLVKFVPFKDEVNDSLLIKTPDGKWLCSGRGNPELNLSQSTDGNFYIWVVNRLPSAKSKGLIVISER